MHISVCEAAYGHGVVCMSMCTHTLWWLCLKWLCQTINLKELF